MYSFCRSNNKRLINILSPAKEYSFLKYCSTSSSASNRRNVLVSTSELLSKISQKNDKLFILDASWHMPKSERDGKDEFLECHIPGNTFFFDIDRIADKSSNLPHTFPKAEVFQEYVNSISLPKNSEVVVYDSVGMFSAARCWYIFKHFGHPNVKMLDGGLKQWVVENKPVVSGEEIIPSDDSDNLFQASNNNQNVVSLNDMNPNDSCNDFKIIDARSSARFYGKVEEPRAGVRSGHIPGSFNVPFNKLLKDPDAMDSFKSDEDLFKAFQDINIDLSDTTQPIVTTCGSGVTACVIIAAMEILGRNTAVKLFDDSWTGYGSSDFEISTKNKRLLEMFSKCDIRVGEILEVSSVSDSNKLYCQQIDVGEDSPRQIVSGIASYYTPEELVSKKVLVLCNLKKAKLAKVESMGMILCAKNVDGNDTVEIVEPPSGDYVQNGERVSLLDCAAVDLGQPVTANQMKKKKVFETTRKYLQTNDDCIATFDDIPLIVGSANRVCKVNTIKRGFIS
jgi:thiosulfate/3-mercaptopyruvate sulfurtransferase